MTTAWSTGPSGTRLPDGFTVRLADDVHRSRDGRLLLGGSPPRLLRLGRRAAHLLARGEFTVSGPGTAELARRLLDAGVTNPRPAGVPVTGTTVVIPVRDRIDMLERLLTALRDDRQTADLPVVVVDDGSTDTTAALADAHPLRPTVLRHPSNRGLGAARTTGIAAASTPLVAFTDDDCRPAPHWLAGLVAALVAIAADLQTMVTRRFSVFDPVVLTITQLSAGEAVNVIPATASLGAETEIGSREAANRSASAPGTTR